MFDDLAINICDLALAASASASVFAAAGFDADAVVVFSAVATGPPVAASPCKGATAHLRAIHARRARLSCHPRPLMLRLFGNS